MKIALLDPGLESPRGHHFDLDLRLARAFGEQGHEVEAHGWVEMPPAFQAMAASEGLVLKGTFRVKTYAPISPGRVPIDAYEEMARSTAVDLASVPPADLWYWPTLAPYQLAAAVQNGSSVRQLGGVWWTPRFPHEVGALMWSRCVRSLAEHPRRIVVGAYDEVIGRAYRSYSPELEMVQLPCPHDGARKIDHPSELRSIGFFGHQRPERGVDLLPQLVTTLLQRNYQVVVQDSGGTLSQKRGHPHLRILPYVNDFAAEMARCDLVVWPSRWMYYTQCFSGVVSECIATGVPVIVPSGCLPADLVARYGCAMLFHDYSPEGILGVVEDAAADFPLHVARARKAAIEWHRVNGTRRLVGWIGSLAGGTT